MMIAPIIEVKNLYKKYKQADTYSVDNLSLDINSQEVFGILGPNGAGKTTLISMLCGLIQPTEGSIKIQGMNYAQQEYKIKEQIGVVPQEYALYETLTARQNLRFFGATYGLKGPALDAIIEDYMTKLGLGNVIDKKVGSYSGGMKRRVNLIAAVMHQPKLLFLDEPTVGVDVQSRQAIMTFLKSLNEAQTTIIYTSHHLEEAQHFCTNIVIIDNGKIVTRGAPQTLIDQTPEARDLEDVFLALTGYKLR